MLVTTWGPSPWFFDTSSRAGRREGFKQGGFLDLDMSSFFVLFCPFWDFLDFSRIFPICPGIDYPGIFLICPFPLSWPINSTYEEQSRNGPRHNPDLPREMWETPRLTFSQHPHSIQPRRAQPPPFPTEHTKSGVP